MRDRGVHGRGVCVAGGVCMAEGACMAGGVCGRGVCMAGGACVEGGVHGSGGVCGRYYEIWSMSGQYCHAHHPPPNRMTEKMRITHFFMHRINIDTVSMYMFTGSRFQIKTRMHYSRTHTGMHSCFNLKTGACKHVHTNSVNVYSMHKKVSNSFFSV